MSSQLSVTISCCHFGTLLRQLQHGEAENFWPRIDLLVLRGKEKRNSAPLSKRVMSTNLMTNPTV